MRESIKEYVISTNKSKYNIFLGKNTYMNPKVIVLILSYNGKQLLDEAVSSYIANDYSNFDVVVIDNGSTDETEALLSHKYPTIQVIRIEKNLGYSGGFNVGMRFAFDQKKTDYVLITNNDVKADKHLIKELVKTAERDQSIGFTIGKTYYYDQPNVLQSVGRTEHPITWKNRHLGLGEHDEGQYDTIIERPFCDDIYWLVRREMYERTGGYDTNFKFQAEDFDWQVRAKKAGYKIMYTPYAKLWHKGSVTIGKDSPMKAFYDYRNPTIVIMKYRDCKYFKRYFQFLVKKLLKSTIKNLIKLRLYYVFKQWHGISLAVFWGVKHRYLSIKHFI